MALVCLPGTAAITWYLDKDKWTADTSDPLTDTFSAAGPGNIVTYYVGPLTTMPAGYTSANGINYVGSDWNDYNKHEALRDVGAGINFPNSEVLSLELLPFGGAIGINLMINLPRPTRALWMEAAPFGRTPQSVLGTNTGEADYMPWGANLDPEGFTSVGFVSGQPFTSLSLFIPFYGTGINLREVTAAIVPEPNALLCVGLGLLVVLCRTRGRGILPRHGPLPAVDDSREAALH